MARGVIWSNKHSVHSCAKYWRRHGRRAKASFTRQCKSSYKACRLSRNILLSSLISGLQEFSEVFLISTLLRNHIQPERWGTDRFFSYYHFSYIYGLFHCIFKIFHWGPSEKMPVLYAAMAENHFRVAKSGFWGEFSQVLGGTLGGSVFRNFSIRRSEVPFPRYRNSRVFT